MLEMCRSNLRQRINKWFFPERSCQYFFILSLNDWEQKLVKKSPNRSSFILYFTTSKAQWFCLVKSNLYEIHFQCLMFWSLKKNCILQFYLCKRFINIQIEVLLSHHFKVIINIKEKQKKNRNVIFGAVIYCDTYCIVIRVLQCVLLSIHTPTIYIS